MEYIFSSVGKMTKTTKALTRYAQDGVKQDEAKVAEENFFVFSVKVHFLHSVHC